nr:hypothetical protein CFP56_34753 [Quercus suber]
MLVWVSLNAQQSNGRCNGKKDPDTTKAVSGDSSSAASFAVLSTNLMHVILRSVVDQASCCGNWSSSSQW